MKNMIGTGSALERLKRIIPASVQPKFNSVEEWQAWQESEGRKRSEEIDKLNQRSRAEKIFGRSGIQDLHRSCTFANYQVTGDGQKKALSLAKAMPRISVVVSPASYSVERRVPGKTIWPPPSVIIFSLPGVPFWWSLFLT